MKKTITLTLSLLLQITLFHPASAQGGMGKIDEIESVKKRTLIVMIEEPREKVLKKIAKRPKLGSVDEYKRDLATYNESIKTVVEAFWPYNKEGIQYKTFKEIDALHDKKSKEYAVLLCISTKASAFRAGYIYSEGLWWAKDIKEDFDDRKDGIFSSFVVNRIEDFGKTPVFSVPLFDIFPTKASMVYGIKSTEFYFNQRISRKKDGKSKGELMDQAEENLAKRAPGLATRTLLLREEWLDPELTPANVSKYYPYPFKICDKEFMDQAIMDKDPQYAYGIELPTVVSSSNRNYLIYVQFVMDAVDNEPICVIRPSTGGMMLGSLTGKAGSRNFTIKTLTKIVEQVKGVK